MVKVVNPNVLFRKNKRREKSTKEQKPLNYLEALMHIMKGNIGTGCFAMAFGFKNSGIFVGVICSVIISLISLHVQHILLRCAEYIKSKNNLDLPPDYALTMEACFLCSESPIIRKSAKTFKNFCYMFICLTQFGFCCLYLIFVADNVTQVLENHGIKINVHLMQLIVFIPIAGSCLILQLKYIAIISTMATICMITGLFLTIGYATRDLPDITDVPLVASLDRYPIFFGVVLFAFEGIALILPVSSAMLKPKTFSRHGSGVLDVGIFFVTLAFVGIGFIGYWRYGEESEGSLTLNLKADDYFAQIIKLIVSLGIALGMPIAFYVPIDLLFPSLLGDFNFVKRYHTISEMIFRFGCCSVVLLLAEFVPNFSLLLSLIGSVCCTMLAFIMPVIGELVIANNDEHGIPKLMLVKDAIILLIGAVGMIIGGGTSIIEMFQG